MATVPSLPTSSPLSSSLRLVMASGSAGGHPPAICTQAMDNTTRLRRHHLGRRIRPLQSSSCSKNPPTRGKTKTVSSSAADCNPRAVTYQDMWLAMPQRFALLHDTPSELPAAVLMHLHPLQVPPAFHGQYGHQEQPQDRGLQGERELDLRQLQARPGKVWDGRAGGRHRGPDAEARLRFGWSPWEGRKGKPPGMADP